MGSNNNKQIEFLARAIVNRLEDRGLVEFGDAEEGIKLVRGDNVTEGKLRWGEKTRCWPEPADNLRPFFLAVDDVLIGMDGSNPIGLSHFQNQTTGKVSRTTKIGLMALEMMPETFQ